MQQIVLATESRYKKSLFSRLNLPFVSVPANIDESPLPNEAAEPLAKRLAAAKAAQVNNEGEHLKSWIIGADQSAQHLNQIVSKPLSHSRAVADLQNYSGQQVIFYTAVCVLSPDGQQSDLMDKTSVRFRDLNVSEIEAYLKIEQPYDCAGAFKAEELGITLFESIESRDPTALIGLPLILLSNYFRRQGFDLYNH